VTRSLGRARHASHSGKRPLHVVVAPRVEHESELVTASGGGSASELEASIPTEVVEVCRAAVDPLEIAATLEASGVTSRVAVEQFG